MMTFQPLLSSLSCSEFFPLPPTSSSPFTSSSTFLNTDIRDTRSAATSVLAMPPRRKKELRDSMLTHTFFNQTGSGSGTCPCCSTPDDIHKRATKPVRFDDPEDRQFAEKDLDIKKLSAEMDAFWKGKYDKLPPEEIQKLHADLQMHPTKFSSQAAPRALKVVHQQMTDAPVTVGSSQPMETFDLGNLDDIAKGFHGLCKRYEDEEERAMAELAGIVSKLAVTATDTTRLSEDRLAAELEMHVSNLYSKINVPFKSCLRQVQLFNIEKRFGFVEESYRALCNDDRKRRGEDVPAELPLSFRQKWNNPFKLTDPALKSRKRDQKKEEKKEKKQEIEKKLNLDEALVEFQRNSKLAIKEMQELRKTISDTETRTEPPDKPTCFSYADVPIPKDIPDHIRQRFLDSEFAFQEVMVLQDEGSKQLLRIRSTFVAWYSTSQEVWEFGKTHIHEMPLFREFEYTRISLLALFYVASRQEVKIVEFYSSKGAKLPPAMNAAFRLKSLSLEEFEKDWEVRCLKLQNAIPSVGDMMAEIDEMLKGIAEEDRSKVEWWRWLADRPQ